MVGVALHSNIEFLEENEFINNKRISTNNKENEKKFAR